MGELGTVGEHCSQDMSAVEGHCSQELGAVEGHCNHDEGQIVPKYGHYTGELLCNHCSHYVQIQENLGVPEIKYCVLPRLG